MQSVTTPAETPKDSEMPTRTEDEETGLLGNRPKLNKTPLHLACSLMIFAFFGVICVILYDLITCPKSYEATCYSKKTIGTVGMVSFLTASICCCITCCLGLAYALITP
jgi:hypothetical protein